METNAVSVDPYSVVVTSAILNWRRVVRVGLACLALYLITQYLMTNDKSADISPLVGIVAVVAVVAFLAGTPFITLTVAVDAASDDTADITTIPPEQFYAAVDSIVYSARQQVRWSPTRTHLAQVRMRLTPRLLSDIYVTRTATLMIPIVYWEPFGSDENKNDD